MSRKYPSPAAVKRSSTKRKAQIAFWEASLELTMCCGTIPTFTVGSKSDDFIMKVIKDLWASGWVAEFSDGILT